MLCPRCALTMALSAADDAGELPHELFPELIIEGPLGRGGFGHVVKAQHRRLERPVALKSLDDLLARSAETRALFTREMAAAGRLDHPGIVRAYDAGEREGHWYLITEYVDGMDAGALVSKHGRLPVAEACEVVRQAALALDYAHGRGLIHRDVKPGNLMLTSGMAGPCAVKVLDFGLAASAGAHGHAGGTPGYTAPEMLRAGTAADARADVYSLGATLRRFLTGQPPEGCERSITMPRMHLSATGAVPAASPMQERPVLPRRLTELCSRLTADDPSLRPDSAAEVAALLAPWAHGADLARLFQDGPLPEKPCPAFWRLYPRIAAGLAVAAVACVAVSLILWLASRKPEPSGGAPGSFSRPVFSPDLLAARQLTPEIAPRLLTSDWEPDFVFARPDTMQAARFLPDGRVLALTDGPTGKAVGIVYAERDRQILVSLKDVTDAHGIAWDSVSSRILWTRENEPSGLHLQRAEADGRPLPGIRFDFSPEFPAGTFAIARNVLINQGKEVADATPWGLAVVNARQIPENTGLQPGDVLIADAGHRNFGVLQSAPGLWRCRADSDAPAQRLATLPVHDHFPLDVTVSRSGVFLLNRTETIPGLPESDDRNKGYRIYRWDREGLHRCLLRQNLHDPSGIAADPLSTDLYAIQGALLPSASIAFQRVLRLRPVAPDEYEITPIADHFGKFSPCGIAFSDDGKKLLITDSGNRAVVGLRRADGKN